MESEDETKKAYHGIAIAFTGSASAPATGRGSGEDKETIASASGRGTRRGIFSRLATLFGSGEDKETTSGIKGRITSATKGHDATVTAPTTSTDMHPRLTRPTTARDNKTATGSSSIVQRDSRDWVLDAFAFNHHTSNPRLLQLQDQETAAGELETREGGILRTLGTGSVQTDSFHVPGVQYVEGGERNVISVGQLAVDHGLVTVFEPPSCYVKDKKTRKIVGEGCLRSGTYVLDYLRIGQDRGGNGKQLAEGGQGGNQHKGGGDERGGRGGGHGDDQSREGGDDQRGRGDDSSGNQHRGQSGGGDDERGVGGEGGGGDNGGRDSGGSGGRDNGKGGGRMEGGEEEDEEEQGKKDEKDGEKDEDAESKDSSQTGTYLFRHLSQLGKYIAWRKGGVGVGEKEKNKGGGGTEGEGNKQGQEQEQESSEVHVALFGLLRPERFQPCFPLGICPTSEIEERIDEYILDTGASFHVTWNEEDLLEYRQDLHCHTRPPILTLRGIYKSDSDGAGSVNVTRSGYLDGDIKVDGVLLAPKVQMNLISFGQLHCQYGVKLEMDTSFILTRPDGVEVGGGYMKPENHHYVLQYFQPGRLFAHEETFNRNIFGKDFFYQPQLPAQPNDINISSEQ